MYLLIGLPCGYGTIAFVKYIHKSISVLPFPCLVSQRGMKNVRISGEEGEYSYQAQVSPAPHGVILTMESKSQPQRSVSPTPTNASAMERFSYSDFRLWHLNASKYI